MKSSYIVGWRSFANVVVGYIRHFRLGGTLEHTDDKELAKITSASIWQNTADCEDIVPRNNLYIYERSSKRLRTHHVCRSTTLKTAVDSDFYFILLQQAC